MCWEKIKIHELIRKQSMGARNRVGIGLSYRPARLHSLAELVLWNRFLGSLKVYKFGLSLERIFCLSFLWTNLWPQILSSGYWGWGYRAASISLIFHLLVVSSSACFGLLLLGFALEGLTTPFPPPPLVLSTFPFFLAQ
jgi:hypothetical protein